MIITRYHKTESLPLKVEFLTPAFLGGADQNAELRAAPFKNLLRQWWRVAVGSQYDDHAHMLQAEGDLFGSVLDDSQASASASKVRLSLAPVEGAFSLDEKEFILGKTPHPEVNGGMPVSNALYLGFGPITYKKGKTEIKRYIAPGSKAEFLITFPKELSASMFRILQFIDSFGTIGSRSRNGWGSLAFSGNGFESKDIQSYETATISQLIDHGKGKQYPTRLGSDSRGILCWETNDPQNDWKLTMQSLAETYMKLRTQINIKPQGLRERHLLGYPVTNHPIPEWGGNEGRMPSQLRLMVKQNQKKQLVGRILHLPHKLPKQWNSMLGQEEDVWKMVHRNLDQNERFHRCGGAR